MNLWSTSNYQVIKSNIKKPGDNFNGSISCSSIDSKLQLLFQEDEIHSLRLLFDVIQFRMLTQRLRELKSLYRRENDVIARYNQIESFCLVQLMPFLFLSAKLCPDRSDSVYNGSCRLLKFISYASFDTQ